MATEQIANNASSFLMGAISDSDTTITVMNALPFSSVPQFRVLIDLELMLVTAVASTVFTVTRGIEGTIAAAHIDHSQVFQTLTAGAIANLTTTPGPAGPTGPAGTNGTPGTSGALITLCAGFTPQVTGGDVAEFIVPYSSIDGVTSITWNVRRIDFRVGSAGGAPSVTVEVSSGSGAFSPTTVGTITLASGANEGSVISSLGTVTSGEKLRFNPSVISTSQYWTIDVILGA